MANLGRDQMILGYPWFQKFNPHFDWNMHTLKGNIVEINTAGYRTKLATPLQAATLTEADKEEDRKLVQAQIPEAYHKYWEVFSEWASHCYPPKWEEDQRRGTRQNRLQDLPPNRGRTRSHVQVHRRITGKRIYS